MIEYWDRLKPEMDSKKLEIQGLADALGISFQAVVKVRDGGSFGSINNLKAAKLFGLNPEWLASGKGEKQVNTGRANLTAPMFTLQASGSVSDIPATTAQIMPLVPASYGKSAISLDDTLKSLVRHLDAAGHPDAVAGLLVSLVKSPNDPALLFALKTTLEAFAQAERKEA